MNELSHKVESWVERGIISLRTARRILQAEGINAEEALQARAGNRVVTVVAILGAVLIGLGALLFFASNWQAIPVVGKIAIILTSTAFAYGIGYWLKYIKDYAKIGQAVILIGGILYGTGLFLVAQLFHTNANPATLFLIWAAGLLPLVLLLADEWLMVLSTIVFAVWSLSRSFFDISIFRDFNPTANYPFLAILLLVVLPIIVYYRFRTAYAFALLAFLGWFGVANTVWHMNLENFEETIIVQVMLNYFFLGIALMLAGRLMRALPNGEDFSFTTRFLGGAAFAVPTYILSWNAVLFLWTEPPALTGVALYVFWGLIVLVGLLLAAFFMLRGTPEERRLTIREGGALAVFALFGLIFALFPVDAGQSASQAVMGGFGYGETYFHPYVLPWNAVLLAFNIMLIVLGYFERRRLFVNLGLLFFLVHVISRYIDFFALEIPTSLAFIAGGVLLLVLAVALERFRWSLIIKMNTESLPL
ncbi:MAG: DUF2157 domain-containing protein [Candidatus Ryanbacteria bacterium]|nr:DUF2157 domain-containing protein [Candidatus Ryanbacteria bacterium]